MKKGSGLCFACTSPGFQPVLFNHSAQSWQTEPFDHGRREAKQHRAFEGQGFFQGEPGIGQVHSCREQNNHSSKLPRRLWCPEER